MRIGAWLACAISWAIGSARFANSDPSRGTTIDCVMSRDCRGYRPLRHHAFACVSAQPLAKRASGLHAVRVMQDAERAVRWRLVGLVAVLLLIAAALAVWAFNWH